MRKKQKTFEELRDLIVDWAKERNIIFAGNETKQLLKAAAESGELADGIFKNDRALIADGIGDVVVCLVNFSACHKSSTLDNSIVDEAIERSKLFMGNSESDAMFNLLHSIYGLNLSPFDSAMMKSLMWLNVIAVKNDLDLIDCIQVAYNEISGRKGTTVNGGFIKD